MKEAREREKKFEVHRDSLLFRRNIILTLSQRERTRQELDLPSLSSYNQEVEKLALPNQLAGISRVEQFRDYVSSLQDGDIPQLVDYLDNVNPR